MSTLTGAPARTGRPRDERIDRDITTTALAVLAETGFAGFSVAEVASRAGVAKTTVYRRYPTSDDLIAATLERLNDDLPIACKRRLAASAKRPRNVAGWFMGAAYAKPAALCQTKGATAPAPPSPEFGGSSWQGRTGHFPEARMMPPKAPSTAFSAGRSRLRAGGWPN